MDDDTQIAALEALGARIDALTEEVRKLRVTSDLHNDFFYALYDGGIDELRVRVALMFAENKAIENKARIKGEK